MQKLQCELCGSVDIIRTNDGCFQCQHCGCKYTLEQAKALLGTVETTIGTAERERLLKNAQTQYEIGESNKAKETFAKVTEQFPDDYRGWLGLMRTYYAIYGTAEIPNCIVQGELRHFYNVCMKFSPSEDVAAEIRNEWNAFWLGLLKKQFKYSSSHLPENDELRKLIEWHKNCRTLSISKEAAANMEAEWNNLWDTIVRKHLSGELEYKGTTDPEDYKNTTPAMYNYVRSGFENARILNSMNVRYEFDDRRWIPKDLSSDFQFVFYLDSTIQYKTCDEVRTSYHDPRFNGFGTFPRLPQLDEAHLAAIKADVQRYIEIYVERGRCPYCYGWLKKGLLGKRCPKCGAKF